MARGCPATIYSGICLYGYPVLTLKKIEQLVIHHLGHSFHISYHQPLHLRRNPQNFQLSEKILLRSCTIFHFCFYPSFNTFPIFSCFKALVYNKPQLQNKCLFSVYLLLSPIYCPQDMIHSNIYCQGRHKSLKQFRKTFISTFSVILFYSIEQIIVQLGLGLS